jgi:hypothetical protein
MLAGGGSPVRVRRGGVVAASGPSVRSVVFAGCAVIVSLGGHVAAGGSLPGAGVLVAALAVVAVGYRVMLAGRERSWAVLAVGLAAAEGLLHWLFMTGTAAVAGEGLPGDGSMGAMPMPADLPQAAGPLAAGPLAGHGLGMVAGHLAAALVLSWFLRQGEQAVWAAARRSGAQLVWCAWSLMGCAATGWQVLAVRSSVGGLRWWSPPRVSGVGGHWVSGGRAWRGPPAPAGLPV